VRPPPAQVAMLGECARLLATPSSVLLSVSFASSARIALMARHAPALGLRMRLYVVGGGDPARGHEVRGARGCGRAGLVQPLTCVGLLRARGAASSPVASLAHLFFHLFFLKPLFSKLS